MTAQSDRLFLPENFNQLDQPTVAALGEALSGTANAYHGGFDFSEGALSSLVVSPTAEILAAAAMAIDTAANATNLQYIANNPDSVSEELVDLLAASFRVTRKPGTVASGVVRLIFSAPATISVTTSNIFTVNSLEFSPSDDFMVDSDGSGDLQWNKLPNGQFYISVPCTARDAGSAGNIVSGTILEPSITYWTRLEQVIVGQSFNGGTDSETNRDLVNRLIMGLATPVISSKIQMKAALALAFPTSRDSNIANGGDPELTRDKHNLMSVGSGGYADWYIAGSRQLTYDDIKIDLPEPYLQDDAGYHYSLLLTRNDASCIYRVNEAISVPDGITLTIESQDKRGDFTQKKAPKIYDDEEAFNTVLQVIDLRLLSPEPVSRVSLNIVHDPLVNDVQDWVLKCEQNPVGCDLLVKGAIPAIVHVGLNVNVPNNNLIDEDALRNGVAAWVNKIPVGSPITMSGLLYIASALLPTGAFVTQPAILLNIILPDGSEYGVGVNDKSLIDVPPFTTDRTVVFYGSADNVKINLLYLGEVC